MHVTQLGPIVLVLCWCLSGIPVVLSEDASTKCLNDSEATAPKRYIHYMDRKTSLIVQTSNRTLHRLSTEIFKIFMEEMIGYEKVEIIPHSGEFDTEEVMEKLSPAELQNNEFIPKSMIDLEVWIPPGHDLPSTEDNKLVRELGDIGPPGRFSWYIPEELDGPIQGYYNKWDTHIREVHWTALRNNKLVEKFDVDAKTMRLIYENAKANETSYYCPEPRCDKGVYIPPQCTKSPCAVLLTSTPIMDFVIDHIDELQLYVKVAFLGDNLKKTIDTLTSDYKKSRKNKSFMVMYYTPSEIILREKSYIRVIFPQCDYLNTTYSIGCKYEPNRIVKMSWNKVDTLGLTQHIRNFKFNEEDYDYLLTIFERAPDKSDLSGIACQWLRDRSKLWVVDHEKHVIHIGGIFPLHESAYNGRGIVNGAVLAQNMINKDPQILKNYRLHMMVENGKCRPDSVMKIFIDYVTDQYYTNMLGVLGPACSDTVEPLAGVSKLYRTMVISYSAEGSSFSDREKYPYFFRTIGENKDYQHVYLQLFKKLKWKRVAALTEDGQKYTEYISHMQETLEKNDITFVANTKFPRDRDMSQMKRYLEDLKRKSARIIILDVVDPIARTVMCEAFHLKMTSADGHVWFLPTWLNETWYDTDYFNKYKNESVNCTTAEMIKAVTGYFSMAHSFYATNDTKVQGNITVREWMDEYVKLGNRTKLSNYAGYAYDAVWTYALALDKLARKDPEAIYDLHSDNTTFKLVKLIEDTDFVGVSGRIKFRGGPSRFSNINLMQWYSNKTHIVGNFFPNVSDDKPEILGGRLELKRQLLRWFTADRSLPEDGTPPPPTCALESFAKALNVNCEMAIIILNIILICFLFTGVFAVVFVMKRRYDKKVKYTEKYMRHFGIDLRMNPSQISDLDKWEIPRNSVVINRKLGEGAFGTVYGGEANFPEKGWVAVAVKTLKVGSSTEEKLDFLSEAEVMKRFDHKNIIKLLGVCTKDEPIYTIMEFMLYGDLKTFLLARRHLVNDKTIEESDEISSKKLTTMALDAARGLSYLASLKYVHRDVASRNCLINAQRVVKLGDFGMTRPMFENDYYKFTRKGMLPVRWMSPESLALGVFTPASDVWSYGVLLFEIITFGSFPYQGMTNTEVLDYVKNGHTITIPAGVKTQLRGLLKSCWHQDPKMRTRASEIVEFLANNPRLIVPCLEVPLASVQLEDTNQLEINLPEQFRKCSTATVRASPTIPNGIGPSHSFDSKIDPLRRESASDNCLPLDNCCPREPLLGPSKSSSSLLNFGKYVTMQHHNDHARDDGDGDYLAHNPAPPNGYVVSKV